MNSERSSILITNDDGYSSKGLKILLHIIRKNFNNIWVVAPNKNQSAKSQSITINKFISVNKIKKNIFSISGTPTDCIILGINKIFSDKNKPKLILSGINEGVNLGLDLLYSGTVSAAREGSINGVRSIALSVDKVNKKSIDWRSVKYFAPKIIRSILTLKIDNEIFYNINFPSISNELVKGIKIVNLGYRKPGTKIISKKERSIYKYKIPSDRKILVDAKEGEDEYEFKKGYITISLHTYKNLIFSNKEIKKYKKMLRKVIEK